MVISLGEVNESLREIDKEIEQLRQEMDGIMLGGVNDSTQIEGMADEAINKTNRILNNAMRLELTEEDLRTIIQEYKMVINRLDGYGGYHIFHVDMPEGYVSSGEMANAKARLREKVANKKDELELLMEQSESAAEKININQLIKEQRKECEKLEASAEEDRICSRAISQMRIEASIKIAGFKKAYKKVLEIENEYATGEDGNEIEGGIEGEKRRLDDAVQAITERVGKSVEEIFAEQRLKARCEKMKANRDKEPREPFEESDLLSEENAMEPNAIRKKFVLYLIERIITIRAKELEREYMFDPQKVDAIDIGTGEVGESDLQTDFDWEGARRGGEDVWKASGYEDEIDLIIDEISSKISDDDIKILNRQKKVNGDMRAYRNAIRWMEIYMEKILEEAREDQMPQVFIDKLESAIAMGPQALETVFDQSESGEQASLKKGIERKIERLSEMQSCLELLEIMRNIKMERKYRSKKKEDDDIPITKQIRDSEKYLRFGMMSKLEQIRYTFNYLVERKLTGTLHIKEFFASLQKENIEEARKAYATTDLEDPEDEKMMEAESNFQRMRVKFLQAIVENVARNPRKPIVVDQDTIRKAYASTVEKE